MRKILLAILLVIIVFGCTACGAIVTNVPKNPSLDEAEDKVSGQLEILKSDVTLTQDQVLSRIKAEHIKENGGYKDSDEIVVILTLKEDALIDTYNKKYNDTNMTLSQYASSDTGKLQAVRLERQQQALIEKLAKRGLIENVEHTYSTILNGIAVKAKYGKLTSIAQLSEVEDLIFSDTYNLPKSISVDEVSSIENIVDVYETGIFNSGSVDYTGLGTSVAVLDSGFDCSHSVFANQPERLMITEEDVNSVLAQSNAGKHSPDLELYDVYYSKKIPFAYDYADKDSDVFPYDSEHGTHVAGIIGGKDDVITGVAVNTQLVLMKVFPDLDAGAETDDILLALEDAVLLGVDAINMSLGSSCGFVREEDGNKINDVYDAINESGISLLAAASNDYSSGFGGEQGNTNFVTNPDSSTVGSPSTYAAALSVASISGTKSRYLVGNGTQVFFFLESNAITGKPNDFVKELGIKEGETKTYEYVTIPGVGLNVNFQNVDVKGKIALIKRGDNTFEEKAANAKNAGAVACIIYNNIDGDINMSMGKTDHIPTISISKDDGTILAQKSTGKITVSADYQAGPFMSDFSSWGPTPSLEMKPDITAHGGNIKSAIPGGGYDELSGTSMACPNLCGIVVLIRQYLKDTYTTLTPKEISVLANELLMSTATIIVNEEGNPYSPRKQGAGLASLKNAVTTNAYITVDGKDRSKLELMDDPTRSGVYEMKFNIVNLSDVAMTYDLSLVAMTESVSTSDKKHVAETPTILDGDYTLSVGATGGSLKGNMVTVNAGETIAVTLTYTMTQKDKEFIDELFPYGMYVEGFVKMAAVTDDENEKIDLNVPFLAFYGDWTQAPMFDKTYYEVETQAHDQAIDEEDKIKADYYATTPYGSYYYNYIIPLGTYLYDIDESVYDAIPATEDHIALSNSLGTIDGISSVYAGLLRNAKTMEFTITDKLTGEVVYEFTDYNAQKAHSYGGGPIPYYEFLKISSYRQGFVNNHQYEFKMKGLLDYGDGGAETNVRNEFAFDFYMDEEAPILKEVSYEKIYDKTKKEDRYYINMTIYDNHYVQSVAPIIFTSQSSYTFLTDNPIPVYSEMGKDNHIRFEITDYLKDIGNDEIITSALAFSIDDYALNSNIYLCQLPGTKGDFKFTKDGTEDGTDCVILSAYEDEIVDLTRYLYTGDTSVDENKDYLKYLTWSSSNEKIVEVKDGLLKCKAPGRATVTVKEEMEGKQAVVIINVKAKEEEVAPALEETIVDSITDSTIKDIRFSYFDTLFAYSRAAQTSEIGSTGDRKFLSSMSAISFYPGEKVQLFHDFDPWYAEDKYELTYSSTNEKVAIVDQEGVVTALKEGTATIVLKVAGSNLMARVKLIVKSEFVIEDRILVAYKGLGGEVVIPDDEGILYIGSYAFCLYETDETIELPEDDYDANKIPSANTTVTSVVIPHGVEDIQKFAFFNCSGLRSVTLPDTVKWIRECAFYNDVKLESINLEKTETIGREAFYNCENLEEIDLSKVLTIGVRAFENCTKLKEVDLTALRNTGRETFKGCEALTSAKLGENTKLSYGMFVNSGLTTVDIYEKVAIPDFCFAECHDLVTVNIHNPVESIGFGAFCECEKLETVNFKASVNALGDQVFYDCDSLTKITLPDSSFTLGDNAFYQCDNLAEVEFGANTNITNVYGALFAETALTTFTVNAQNPNYASSDGLLTSKDGKKIILASTAKEFGTLTLDSKYDEVGASAFAGANIEELVITNKDLVIGEFAFAYAVNLAKVVLPEEEGFVVSGYSFHSTEALTEVVNLDKVTSIGDYAFAYSTVKNLTLGEDATVGEGAFFYSHLESVTIGANSTFGLGAFQNCKSLKTVNMPEGGNVIFGTACFAYDTALTTIDLSKAGESVGDEAFYGCSSLKSANLQKVKSVGAYAFADCSTLSYVSVPMVEFIGEGAFGQYEEYGGGAPIFESITLPNTLEEMGDGVFIGCNGLLEVEIPSSMTEIPDFTFSYCANLSSVTIPSSVKRVGAYAFVGCTYLKNFNLGSVEEIGEYAFYQVGAEAFSNYAAGIKLDLTSVETIGEGAFADADLIGDVTANKLEVLGGYAFQNAGFKSFVANNLREIGDAAFAYNASLKEFTFSDKLESIGLMVFAGCESLSKYYGIVEGEKISNGDINDYAKLIDNVLYTYMKSGKLQLTSLPQNYDATTLTVADNTYRIEFYAGNENKNINKVILPDSMKAIGNYAFFGCDNLARVEFKSFTAPALENSYSNDAVLGEEDPGYDLIHNIYDLFGLELCYYNFIDLLGKRTPIKITLPANEGLIGYDSIVYEGYFGKVENATRSEYVAMEKSLIDFYTYAEKLQAIKVLTLSHETLINKALTAYNAIKQNPADYGYDAEEYKALGELVLNLKQQIIKLKLANAEKRVQDIQKEIDALPEVFTADLLSKLGNLSVRINALKGDQKALLDMTKYNAMIQSLETYNQGLTADAEVLKEIVKNNTFGATEVVAALSLMAVLAYVGKRTIA